MRKLLTDRGLKALKATGVQYAVWDGPEPSGFGVRVSAKGKKAFIVMKRPAGGSRPVRTTLGHYPGMTLKEAQAAASAALKELMAGKRPKDERRRRLDAQRASDEQIFGTVADRYKAHIADRRTVGQIRQTVDRELVSRWGKRSIESISRREVIAMVEQVKEDSGPAAARQALAYGKRIFGFAVARDLLATSPADHVSALELVGKKKPRQRTLSDDEIRLLWEATPWNTDAEMEGRGRWPLAPFTRLLLLLGVRRGELGSATWSQVDLDARRWLIPIESAKTDEAHLVPLPLDAVDIFKSLPRFTGGDLVFTNDGKHRLGGWNGLKTELDRKVGNIPHWTFHDIRRTARTNWSILKVEPHIAEMMLGHAQPGIHGTYDTYKYEHERRAALELWARRLQEIGSPTPPASNVVHMR